MRKQKQPRSVFSPGGNNLEESSRLSNMIILNQAQHDQPGGGGNNKKSFKMFAGLSQNCGCCLFFDRFQFLTFHRENPTVELLTLPVLLLTLSLLFLPHRWCLNELRKPVAEKQKWCFHFKTSEILSENCFHQGHSVSDGRVECFRCSALSGFYVEG